MEIKNIDDLTLKSSLSGSEQIPVSGTKKVTTQQIADLAPVPTIPSTLPNPYGLTINGEEYDGSEAVELDVGGGAEIFTIIPDMASYTMRELGLAFGFSMPSGSATVASVDFINYLGRLTSGDLEWVISTQSKDPDNFGFGNLGTTAPDSVYLNAYKPLAYKYIENFDYQALDIAAYGMISDSDGNYSYGMMAKLRYNYLQAGLYFYYYL